jgi:hypothetical protein
MTTSTITRYPDPTGPIGRALAAGLDRYSLDVKDLSSAVANRATRPCRHRSARWRRRAVS